MLGPVVNALTIVLCSLAGAFFIKGIPPRFESLIKKAIGLSIVFVGIRGAMDNENILLLVMSMVAGAAAGELIGIDRFMNRIGNWAEKKLKLSKSGGRDSERFAEGFVSSSVIFCTGSMAVVGALQSGLGGSHETLFTKSILDGSISLVFGASLGIGVAFSALPVLLYEGAITLAAMSVRDMLKPELVREMSAAGSLVICGIGFNFLGMKEEIKVANLIPAIFIPCVYFAFK